MHAKFVRSGARDETRRECSHTVSRNVCACVCSRARMCVLAAREARDGPATTVKETRARGRTERGNAGAAG